MASATRLPLRLRDVRRLLASHIADVRALRAHYLAANSSLGSALDALGLYCVYVDGHTARDLDRLISRHGPDALVAYLRRQADRTDHQVGDDWIEVNDCSAEDSPSHGGDGNSGECQHEAVTRADDRHGFDSVRDTGSTEDTPDGTSAADRGSDGLSEATESEAADASACEGEGTPTGQGETGPDEGTAEMGTDRDDARAAGDETGTGTPGPAQAGESGIDADLATEPQAGEHGEHGLATHDAGDRVADGEAGTPDARIDFGARHYARIASALRRLAGANTRGNQSPLWDGRALVRELVSRRYAMHRARKLMSSPSGLLVITDWSGSCLHVSAILEEAAEAALTSGLRVAVAPTATYLGLAHPIYPEGVVIPWKVRGNRDLVAAIRRAANGPVMPDDWRRFAASARISHILVLGDVHGHACYEAARDAGVKVLWADPNGHEMPVDDTRGMTYTIIRDGSPAAIADAIEWLARRAS